MSIVSAEDRCAERHARRLLAELGSDAVVRGRADHPALAWRRAGLMEITGAPDGKALVCPAALAGAADGAMLALKALAPDPERLPPNGAMLLGERARMMGLRRQGEISANGACRLLDTADGRIALNLARTEDWALMPILIGRDEAPDWPAVAAGFAVSTAAEIMARGLELGLPIALDRPAASCETLFEPMPASLRPRRGAPLVVDLASLWAGPLAASLLAMLGADVIKVESLDRPDGARLGHGAFYDLLNGSKRSMALDFRSKTGLARLRDLIVRADIVIEGSRPRALRRLGIDRDAAVARGTVWIGITAHGGEAGADRVGFGDDAAVAAGIATLMAKGWGRAMFAGDAVADPLTGLYAALGGWAAWQGGGGRLIRLSLADTVAHAIGAGVADAPTLAGWQALAEADREPLYPLRRASKRAPVSGADNADVLARC